MGLSAHLSQMLGQAAALGLLIDVKAGQQDALTVALHVQQVLDALLVVVHRLAIRHKLHMVCNCPACQ